MALGARIGISALALFAISACNPTETEPSTADVLKRQERSFLGPTSKWQPIDGPWAGEIQAMRDRAYQFCAERYEDARQCENESDESLIAARNAEWFALNAKSHPHSVHPFEKSLAERPEVFAQVRQYCFESYRAAGSKDVRLLGPCLSVATGADYFGIVPVR